MKPIDIDIYHHTEDTETWQRIGVDYPISNAVLRKITFYNINAVSQCFDGDVEYSAIHANGNEYCCPLTKDELNKLIRSNL